ncbi:hypothetical protein [Escherichia coli]
MNIKGWLLNEPNYRWDSWPDIRKAVIGFTARGVPISTV